jgi:hypothetical protein
VVLVALFEFGVAVVSGFVVASGSLLSPPVVVVDVLDGVPGVVVAGAALLF